MRPSHWVVIAIFGLVLTGCASMHTAPTPEVRQALAPTGKLRVGLQLGTPHNVIRDSVSGEMKGVGFDLGKEFARRIGVPFEPVLYPSVGELLDAGKSGAWDVAFVGFSPARRSGTSRRCTWKSNSVTSSPAVLRSQQWLMWIGPGFELPCGEVRSGCLFF